MVATARIRSRGYLGTGRGEGEYTFQCVCECARASAHVKKKTRVWRYDSGRPCLPLEVGRTPTADETRAPGPSGGTRREKQRRERKMPREEGAGSGAAQSSRDGTRLLWWHWGVCGHPERRQAAATPPASPQPHSPAPPGMRGPCDTPPPPRRRDSGTKWRRTKFWKKKGDWPPRRFARALFGAFCFFFCVPLIPFHRLFTSRFATRATTLIFFQLQPLLLTITWFRKKKQTIAVKKRHLRSRATVRRRTVRAYYRLRKSSISISTPAIDSHLIIAYINTHQHPTS